MITSGPSTVHIGCDNVGCDTPDEASSWPLGELPDEAALRKQHVGWFQVARGRIFCRRCYEAGTRIVHADPRERYLTGIAARIVQGDEVLATIGVELSPAAQDYALNVVRQRLARETE